MVRALAQQVDAIGVFLLMLHVFTYIMFSFKENSDLYAHANIALEMLEENRLFGGNFLMYFMANLLTMFTGSIKAISMAIVLLISLSNTAKYIMVREVFSEFCDRKEAQIASLSLLLVFVIPVLHYLNFFTTISFLNEQSMLYQKELFGDVLDPNAMYLGYCVPNVWHNSTVLCMMPFAIVTFFLSVRQLKEYDMRRNGMLLLFIVLGTLVKPSFFFTYAIAYPLCVLIRYRNKKVFLSSFLPVLVGCICMLYEFVTIFNGDEVGGVTISFAPLFTWEFWSPRLVFFVVSMSFPFFFVVIYWKRINRDIEFWFVLMLLIVALGVAWCCQETGERAMHGNFGWQIISSMWFVYFYMLKVIVKTSLEEENENQRAFSLFRGRLFEVLFGLHVLSGLSYLIRYLIIGNYF